MWGNRHSNKDHHWTLAKTGNQHYPLSGFHINFLPYRPNTPKVLQYPVTFSVKVFALCPMKYSTYIYALTCSNGREGTHSGAGPSNSGPHHSTPKAIFNLQGYGSCISACGGSECSSISSRKFPGPGKLGFWSGMTLDYYSYCLLFIMIFIASHIQYTEGHLSYRD